MQIDGIATTPLGEAALAQDITYRPFAEHLFDACHQLPREMALDALAKMLREFHALPLDIEPRLQVVPG